MDDKTLSTGAGGFMAGPVTLDESPRDAAYFAEKYAFQPITRTLLATAEHDLAILEREDQIERQTTPEREAAKMVLETVIREIKDRVYG